MISQTINGPTGSLQVSLFALILPAVLALRLPPASALIVVLELVS